MEKFGPVYDICIVKGFKDKLAYFHQLDDLDQRLKEENLQLQARPNDQKTQKKVQKLRQKRIDLMETI